MTEPRPSTSMMPAPSPRSRPSSAAAPATATGPADGRLTRASQGPVVKTKHRKINKQHPEFELTYDMMLGIRTVVSKAEAQSRGDLLSHDYTESVKLRFPGRGSIITPAHQMRDFKFKDYSPYVFRKIRECFSINPADYLLCVCGNFQYLEFISNSKSGQFFFYTHDRQFMIKTVSKQECKFLRSILPAYYQHIVDNPNTLLTRFFGMHKVKPHKKQQRHFLIMSSVFFTDRYIHTVYDLKGSTQGRYATPKEKLSGTCVYKDNDFLDSKQKLTLDAAKAKQLNEQISEDVEFLRKLDIMDYSLLLGIHYKDRAVPAHYQSDRTFDGSLNERETTRSGATSVGHLEKEFHHHQLQQPVSVNGLGNTAVEGDKPSVIHVALNKDSVNHTDSQHPQPSSRETANSDSSLIISTTTSKPIESRAQAETISNNTENSVAVAPITTDANAGGEGLTVALPQESPRSPNVEGGPHWHDEASPSPANQQHSTSDTEDETANPDTNITLEELHLTLPTETRTIDEVSNPLSTVTSPHHPQPLSAPPAIGDASPTHQQLPVIQPHHHGHQQSLSLTGINPVHLLTVPNTPAATTSSLTQSQSINHLPSHHQQTPSLDFKRQSNYGLPKRYNKTSKPSDIAFDAPEFEPVHVPESLDSPRAARSRPTTGTIVVDDRPRSSVGNGATVDQSTVTTSIVTAPPTATDTVTNDSTILLSYHGGINSVDEHGNEGREIYFMGIIDILVVYNLGKWVENRYKRARLQKGISAVSPRKYAERFKAFIGAGIRAIERRTKADTAAVVANPSQAPNGVTQTNGK